MTNFGSATLANTISATNTGSGSGGKDVDGSFTSHGYNFIGTADRSTGLTGPGDQTGTDAARLDPKLGPLQNNGGLTHTMALLNSPIISPAIDQGKSFGLTLA